MPVIARTELFKIENVIGSYLWILQPQKKVDKGVVTFKYNATFLWPKTTPVLMGKWQSGTDFNVKEEAGRLATEAWKEAAADLVRNKVVKDPFLDGDGPQGVNKKTGKRHAGYEGHSFIRCGADDKHQPGAVDNKLGADNKLVAITDPKRLYPGAYYNIVVNMFAWQHDEGGKGISFGLTSVQFAKDGERLQPEGAGGGGGDAGAFFTGVKSAEKPAAVADGAGAGGLFA